jgi:hypothetical protein
MWARDKDRMVRYMAKHCHVQVECGEDDKAVLSYDLGELKGGRQIIMKYNGESYDEAQRRFLLEFSKSHDIERIDGVPTLVMKGSTMLTFPKVVEGMTQAANAFPMRIPEWRSTWFPSATIKEKLDPEHVEIVKMTDKYQLNWRFPNQVLPDQMENLCLNDYWVENVSRHEVEIPSLKVLCLRLLSIYNLSFGGTKNYPYVTDAQYNPVIGLEAKLLKMFKTNVGVDVSYDFNDTHCALKFYYSYCVDLKPIRFELNEGDFKYWHFTKSKSSLRRYPNLDDVDLKGVTVKFTSHPTKKQASHIIMGEVIQQLNMIFEETRYEVPLVKNILRHITSISDKHQRLSCLDSGSVNEEDAKKMYHKMRLFFLSGDAGLHNLLHTRHQERTYAPDSFEIRRNGAITAKYARNSSVHIDIGAKWTEGGAYLKYLQLFGDEMDIYDEIETGYNDSQTINKTYVQSQEGTMMVADGDVEALDLHINSMMLMIYMMMGSLWIIKEDTHMYRMYQYLLEGCAEQLAGKCVRWLKDFLFLIGIMPSGSIETSHGDSWIVGVMMYLTFIFYKMRVSTKEVRRKIWDALCARRLVILITGDDFVMAYPRDLDCYVGIEPFCEYCTQVYHMNFKHKNKYFSLVTYLRVSNSQVMNVVFQGPIYLKRSWILSSNFNLEYSDPEIARIVPWRPFIQYKWRMAIPKDNKDIYCKNLARLIGLVYDSLGVEPITYDVLFYMYKKTYDRSLTMFRNKGELDDRLAEWVDEDKKYYYKVGIKHVKPQFPSRKTLLRRSHFDRDAHRPPHGTQSWQQWAEKAWDMGYYA